MKRTSSKDFSWLSNKVTAGKEGRKTLLGEQLERTGELFEPYSRHLAYFCLS